MKMNLFRRFLKFLYTKLFIEEMIIIKVTENLF